MTVPSGRPGFQLAELNVARLLAPTDDQRVGEFMGALDRINTLGKRVPGFVWLMKGEQAGNGNTDAKIGGDRRYMSNLTVWNTVHRQFHQRLARCISCRGRCLRAPSLAG